VPQGTVNRTDVRGYRWRKVEKELRRAHIYTARFFSSHIRFFNLRNHRKILCIDGETAFIGGMNIARDNLSKEVSSAKAVQDIHFEVSGPVIDQINQAFADDWHFASDIPLKVTSWAGEAEGQVVARFLPDGPDEHYKKLEWTLLAAINNAERDIRIITPYFIPNSVTLNALHMAILRGVEIELLIPEKVDIHALNWVIASNHQKILDLGIKIYLTPPPFEHSKLCMVDDTWAFIGSSNWDERSFSLNFEANLECYDTRLNRQLVDIFEQKKRNAKELLKEDCQSHSLPVRLRNNFIRLFTPYL
jgi:cardiolipin synthase